MSEDPILTELRAAAANAKAAADAAKGIDPAKIGQKAAEGAERGAARALNGADIPAAARALQAVVSDLRQWAIPAARMAQEAQDQRRWWKPTLIALIVLLGLLIAFVGGVVYIRSGLTMTTETGCLYLGGVWSSKEDGSGFVCWQDTN